LIGPTISPGNPGTNYLVGCYAKFGNFNSARSSLRPHTSSIHFDFEHPLTELVEVGFQIDGGAPYSTNLNLRAAMRESHYGEIIVNLVIYSHTRTVELMIEKDISIVAPDDWPAMEFSYVKLYLYNLDNKGVPQIIEKGQLHESAFNPAGFRLSEDQKGRIQGAINQTRMEHDHASCYIPHHGFVYYNNDDKPVAWLSVCFMCSGYVFSPDIKVEFIDLDELKNIIQEAKLPIFKDLDEAEKYKKKHE